MPQAQAQPKAQTQALAEAQVPEEWTTRKLIIFFAFALVVF